MAQGKITVQVTADDLLAGGESEFFARIMSAYLKDQGVESAAAVFAKRDLNGVTSYSVEQESPFDVTHVTLSFSLAPRPKKASE